MAVSQSINLRLPTLNDGMSVFRLIQRCPPLDTNSSYCNFLQCGHFSKTSVAAVDDETAELVGFISGYRIPDKPEALFVWQVAVDERARGQGLALRMLKHLVTRPDAADISFLETTITQDNDASWALFKAFANQFSAAFESQLWLDEHAHFEGHHDSEYRVSIGPFSQPTLLTP